MAWFTAIACVGILSLFVMEQAERLPRAQARLLRRWHVGWVVKGVVVPLGIWILFNTGFFAEVPSLVLQPGSPATGAAHYVAVWRSISVGVFVIGTYWAALTAGWLLASFYRRTNMREDFRSNVTLWSFFLGPLTLLIGYSLGWPFAGFSACIWLMPLLHVVREMTPVVVPKPSYSRAVARMNFDKYEEAERAVLHELEKCEDDFEGWMLLAELYAVHFNDLPEAERTLRETCDNPATTDSQRSVALQKLADWRLKLALDPAGARRHLEAICEMMPGTHLAHMAELRIQQLPGTREEYVEQLEAKKLHLPALRKELEEGEETAATAGEREQAISRARLLSERLRANPNSMPEREELARLLAEKLNKVDAGLEQLDLLLTIPERSEAQSAEWLALMGAWQLRYKRDETLGRDTLQRLLRQHPNSSQAFAAQRRLNVMEMEARIRLMRPAVPAAVEAKISVAVE